MELVVRRLTLTGSSRRCWLSLTARASHVSNAPDLSACRLLRRLAVLMVAAVAAVWTQTAVAADPTVSISRPVVRVQTVRLPRSVTNVAVHWRGNASARLRIAVSRESLRFDGTGKEIWPSAFYPVQKVIVHHTATQNNDPDPPATIRSIYQYHAITMGWGDIGYNFLIDESGRIYEGRYSRQYAAGESPTGEDLSGSGVTAAHTQGYNSGTVGIALLGTLTNQDTTPAARSALEHLIAWIDDAHGIDPQGGALYTNPVSGTQATFPNIAGHRDLAATECPGGVFYATLPTIRSDVAALIAAAQPGFSIAAAPASQSVVQGGSANYSVTVSRTGGFTDPVTLSVAGVPAGTNAAFAPNPADSSTLTLTTSSATPTGSYVLAITGATATTTHSTSATLVVTQPPPPPSPDFSLSAAPSSESIVRGGAASYTVSVNASAGFTGAVTLGVTGLPAGAAATFSPNPTSMTSTLTVRTTSTTKTGTYTLSISGTAGALAHVTTATLQVRRK